MARQPRPALAGIAQHVVQRGNDRQPCFFSEADYDRYLHDLVMASRRSGVAVHAYVLMTNDVHLLVTPEEGGAAARMMQCLGRHYVSYVSRTYRRTATLWEGRHKSCLEDGPRYLLAYSANPGPQTRVRVHFLLVGFLRSVADCAACLSSPVLHAVRVAPRSRHGSDRDRMHAGVAGAGG